MASLTVKEKIRIKLSRRQHKENERDSRAVAQQLVSSIPPSIFDENIVQKKDRRSELKREVSPLS